MYLWYLTWHLGYEFMQCHNNGLLFVFCFFLVTPNISFFLFGCQWVLYSRFWIPTNSATGVFPKWQYTWCWVHQLFGLCFNVDCHIIWNFVTPFFTPSPDLLHYGEKKKKSWPWGMLPLWSVHVVSHLLASFLYTNRSFSCTTLG